MILRSGINALTVSGRSRISGFLCSGAALSCLLLVVGLVGDIDSIRADNGRQNDGAAIAVGSRRELFVDESLVASRAGKCELRLHHPVPHEIAMTHDAPWEGSGRVYHSMFRDGDL